MAHSDLVFEGRMEFCRKIMLKRCISCKKKNLYCRFQKAGKVVAPICNPLKLLISLKRCVIIPMVFSFPSHS